MDEEELEAAYEQTVEFDGKNVKAAMGELIDSLSKFMATDRIDELTPADFAQMLENLDFARFIVSGIMYTHGLPYCGHYHEEEEDVD